MNTIIPLISIYSFPEPFETQEVAKDPTTSARKVEVAVNLDPDIFCRLNQKGIETFIYRVLVHGRMDIEIERLLGMDLYSFSVLKGKRSSWTHGYKAGFVGRYTFMDRRGFGLRQSNSIAAGLKRSADAFHRTFPVTPSGEIVQTPLFASIGGHFNPGLQAKAIRQRMLSVGRAFVVHDLVGQAA